MKNVTCFSPSCKIWINKDPTDMAALLVQCPVCGAMHSFKFDSAEWIREWDIDIPEDWQFGQWGRVDLYQIPVPRPVLVCMACGLRVRLTPSFILKGTRLTLEALVFVTFAKEVGGLKWRTMPELFCAADERCAHSTLYMAVHKIGKLFSKEVGELSRRFTPPGAEHVSDLLHVPVRGGGFPAPSALFRHTLKRELGARFLVTPLLPGGRFGPARFDELFYRHVDAWSRVMANWKKSLPKLYGPYHRRCARMAA